MSRRVRVTVEGDATESPAHGVLRVYVGASRCVMVDPEWSGVTVEDIQPERVWTDGDVVQSLAGIVYLRDGGEWHGVSAVGTYGPNSDAETDRALRVGHLNVLRYQAGE